MANHKSAEKRNRQSKIRRSRNRVNKTRMKNAIHSVDESIGDGENSQAKEALQNAISVIAKTASKGTIHKKTASRNISRLTKRVNKMNAIIFLLDIICCTYNKIGFS